MKLKELLKELDQLLNKEVYQVEDYESYPLEEDLEEVYFRLRFKDQFDYTYEDLENAKKLIDWINLKK